MKRAAVSTDNSRLLGLVAAVVVIALLYLARVVFVPLSLALLFSVVLTPPVAGRKKVPRILAIFLVVLILAGGLGLLGWSTSQQFLDFATQLPAYPQD